MRDEQAPVKRVGGASYFAVCTRAWWSVSVDQSVRAAEVLVGRSVAEIANVVKLEGDPISRVSLLAYEDFSCKAFPALLESCCVDLESERRSHRSYRASSNPPVLHRKELLLPVNDIIREKALNLTADLEQRGLFKDSRHIGFQRNWEQRLAHAGIEIHDHQVVEISKR